MIAAAFVLAAALTTASGDDDSQSYLSPSVIVPCTNCTSYEWRKFLYEQGPAEYRNRIDAMTVVRPFATPIHPAYSVRFSDGGAPIPLHDEKSCHGLAIELWERGIEGYCVIGEKP